MQPTTEQSDPQVFKGDASSVSNTIESFLKAESDYYLEYLSSLKNQTFDTNQYTNWRFTENKANPHRFFLPLSDAVILDLYIYHNLSLSQDQGFNPDLQNYILYKDQIRDTLVFLDPYLIACSFTQTHPSYSGYEQWVNYQQTRGIQIQNFRQQLVPLNTVTFREQVFNAFVSDENNILTIAEYVKFFDRFTTQQQIIEKGYDDQIKYLKDCIGKVNLYVFNDYIEVCETNGIQATAEGYQAYFEDVSQKYDAEYLQGKHEEVEEAEKGENQKIKGKKDNRVDDMNEDEQDLADELQDIEDGKEDLVEVQGDAIEQGGVEINVATQKLEQSKQCQCCKGNVYNCQGQVCLLLGNCICLSE